MGVEGAEHIRFTTLGPEPVTNPLGVEVGAVYEVRYNGIRAVIGPSADRDWVGYLNGEDGVTGLEAAGVRENADTLPEADGGVHGVFRRDRLAFTLKGILPPDAPSSSVTASWITRQAKLKRAAYALRSDGQLLWTPSEAPPVFVNFRAQQPPRITGRRPKVFFLAGVCEDPLVYSQAMNVAQVYGGAGSLVATNLGDGDAWPILTIYGPITNPVITNPTSGGALTFAGTIAAGHYWAIDTNPRWRRIYLDDVTNVYGSLVWASSSWFPLAGMTATTLTLAGTGTAASTGLVAQWRSAWG